MAETFLIKNLDGTTESAEIIERFSMHVARIGTVEFATHKTIEPGNRGLKKLTHYATGLALTWVPLGSDALHCRILAEEVFSRYSAQNIRQRFTEPEQINPAVPTHQPTKEEDMSLEQALIENTAALTEMTAALKQHIANNPGKTAAPAETVAKDKPKDKPKADKAVDTPKEDKKVETTKPAELSLEADVKPIAVKVAAEKGRDSLVALLQRLGCKLGKTTELAGGQFAEFIDLANRTLAGTYDPLASDAPVTEDDI